jgi:hypothetical protein
MSSTGVQVYNCTGVVQCYIGTSFVQLCSCTGVIQKHIEYRHRGNGEVQEYRSCTGVQE